MKPLEPASLAKYLNVELIFISEFVISEIRINSTKIDSKFMNPEIRITSSFRHFSQADRLPGFHFVKPLLNEEIR